MLNNRLEDLIIIYKNYQIKLFIKRTILFIIILLLLSSIYLIYRTLQKLKINSKKSIEKNICLQNHDKVNKIIKIIKIKEPSSINEEKLLQKTRINTLLILERNKPTYFTALDLAKYYFKNSKYQESSKWALIATNRNPKYEEAWLIYAKSKIKLNQKGVAKKALKLYLLKYHSQKVINLLNSI